MIKTKAIHIVWIISNNTTVPYFRWFAEQISKDTDNDFYLSFIFLNDTRPIFIDEVEKFNCKVHWIEFDAKRRKTSLLKTLPKLYKLLKKMNPDAVHTHLFDDSLPTMIVSKFLGIKNRFVTKQDTAFHWKYAKKAVKYDKLINKLATCLIPVSNECKEFILSIEKCEESKIKMIHHGIPTALYVKKNTESINLFKEEHNLKNSFIVGTVSRFIDWKGYKEIVGIAEDLAPKIPSIKFLLVGSGAQKDEIIQLIHQKNLQNYFCLPGYINPSDMPSVYGSMNVYLHAATLEPFGFVIAEALASGLPVVSTPTGAARDAIITKKNGWIADYQRPDQLRDYIFSIYKNNLTLPWEPAQESAIKQFDFSVMYKNYMNLYLQNIK